MKSLFLDISFEEGHAALFSENKVLRSLSLDIQKTRQPCLLWHQLLEDESLSLDDIDFIAVGVGPGSYTGMRSALATAQTVSYALGKPLLLLPSLFLFVPYEDGKYLSAYDARSGGVYLQTFTIDKGFVSQSEPRLVSFSQFCDMGSSCAAVSSSSSWILKKAEDEGIEAPLVRTVRPSLSSMAALSWQYYHEKKFSTYKEARLYYLQKTQPEIEREKRGYISR
jgi:tRNA threonylcarbamoyladenosine biosynthesis protein TsaB